jgi:hypothetical protein
MKNDDLPADISGHLQKREQYAEDYGSIPAPGHSPVIGKYRA